MQAWIWAAAAEWGPRFRGSAVNAATKSSVDSRLKARICSQAGALNDYQKETNDSK
jgi:hypothetical protein